MPELAKIKGGFASVDALNENFDKIEDLFDEVLFRRGNKTPNEMERNLDANSNRIFNLPDPQSDHDAVPYITVKFVAESLEDAVDLKDAAQQSAEDAEGFRNETEGFRDTAESHKNATEGFRNEAEEFRNEAETIVESDLQQEIDIEHVWNFTQGLKVEDNDSTHKGNLRDHLDEVVFPIKILNDFIVPSGLDTSGEIHDIAYGSGKLVVVGSDAGTDLMFISDDGGKTFSDVSDGGLGTFSSLNSVATDGNGLWIVVGSDDSNSVVFNSTDNGESWSEQSISGDDDEPLRGVTFNDDASRVVAVGDNGLVVRGSSPGLFELAGSKGDIDDGESNPNLNDVAFGGTGFSDEIFVAVGNDGFIVRSNENASSWSIIEDNYNDGSDLNKISSDIVGRFLIVGEDETLAWSGDNGISFSNINSPLTGDYKAIAVDLDSEERLWTVAHEDGLVIASSDPSEEDWFAVNVKSEETPNSLAFGDDTWFIGVGNDLYRSLYIKIF